MALPRALPRALPKALPKALSEVLPQALPQAMLTEAIPQVSHISVLLSKFTFFIGFSKFE